MLPYRLVPPIPAAPPFYPPSHQSRLAVPVRDGVGDGSSARNYGYGRPRRGPGHANDGGSDRNLSMRVVGPRRRDVEIIEGAGGETRRVQRQRRSRRADLRSIGLEVMPACLPACRRSFCVAVVLVLVYRCCCCFWRVSRRYVDLDSHPGGCHARCRPVAQLVD